MRPFDRVNDLLVAFPARLLSYYAAVVRNSNIVVKPTSGEIVRMPKTISRFGEVFSDKVRRCMTVVTNSDVAMTRLQPRAVLLIHDMAVSTSLWSVGQIGVAARIHERVRANSYRQSQHNADYDSAKLLHAWSINLTGGAKNRSSRKIQILG